MSRQYCSTCGGAPHPDGQELAGPPGHFTTWGRLAPRMSHRAEPVVEEVVPDGPTMIAERMPDDAPRNALWLAQVPTRVTRIVESKGIWKGREVHVLGVAGICEEGVRFYSRWRKDKGGWKSDAHWLKVDGQPGAVTWNEQRRGLRERVAGI